MADEMGLGKTVEMLALVLANQWPGLEIQGAGQEAVPHGEERGRMTIVEPNGLVKFQGTKILVDFQRTELKDSERVEICLKGVCMGVCEGVTGRAGRVRV